MNQINTKDYALDYVMQTGQAKQLEVVIILNGKEESRKDIMRTIKSFGRNGN
jgi:hypothetical protein